MYAVLTGDLVSSSKLTPEQSRDAMRTLRTHATQFAETFAGSIEGELDTFRHDSWQLLLKKPAFAVRAAIFFRAVLKMQSEHSAKYDSRVAIGVGPVETIARARISDSRGAAFTYSGKALDKMGDERLAFASGRNGESVRSGVVPLLDCVVTDWTPTESRAVFGALLRWTQEQSAANWPGGESERPTRQAVAKSLDRAHWRAVSTVLDWVEGPTQPMEVA
jgi:hypothetical protein